MKRFLFTSALVLAALGPPAGASTSPVFDELMKPYEEIRLALCEDSLEGVVENGAVIRDVAGGDAAGGEAAEVGELLAKIAGFGGDLAEASELADARDAFYEISKLLVRHRSKVAGERPVVVYCAMINKSWLQASGEIANPYSGGSMRDCGEVVEE